MRVLAALACGVLSLAAAAQKGDGFRRVEPPAVWPAPITRIEEPGGSVLEVRDGAVVRRRGARAVTLGCTDPRGPGRVAALALHAYGGVFVAAEHGVYLTDEEHDVLDAPNVRDGFPPGTPLGLHIDARGRLWLATDTSFGVVDTRQLFGRTFTAADGLPPPPFTAFAITSDGRFLLRCAAGVYEYAPDRGAPPRGSVRDASPVLGNADGSVELHPEGTALGGATFRYRLHHRHLLEPLDPAVVRGLKPGTHAIDVLAFDRELACTEIATLDVRIPFPPAADRRTLLPLAALVVALVVALFWVRARRLGGGRPRYARALVSAGLFFVVALQVLAGFLGYGRSWPFVGFSMYTETYREGSVVFRPRLIGLWPDGSSREVQLYEAGLAQDGYWQLYGEMVYGDDGDRERFLRAYAERHPSWPLRGFVIRDERTRLTADGPVAVAPIVMLRYERP